MFPEIDQVNDETGMMIVLDQKLSVHNCLDDFSFHSTPYIISPTRSYLGQPMLRAYFKNPLYTDKDSVESYACWPCLAPQALVSYVPIRFCLILSGLIAMVTNNLSLPPNSLLPVA